MFYGHKYNEVFVKNIICYVKFCGTVLWEMKNIVLFLWGKWFSMKYSLCLLRCYICSACGQMTLECEK